MIFLAAGAAVVAVLLIAAVAVALARDARADAVSPRWRDTHHRRTGRDDG
jgi:type II secretory pathway component PulK